MPVKFSVAPQQFVDESGKPIAGRVTFFKHDSNELAPVFTMQGASFVPAQNPQLLDAMGRIAETVFFDADVLDMKVERYIGEPGAMTVLSPDFTAYDEFQVGLDYKALLDQSGTVSSIAALKEIDPAEFKAIQVQDGPWRTYIWDEFATNTPDDGIVVKSDVTSDGRWLLMWDDEMLPSSIYGVEDGNFVNITMLLSYPDVVGSIGMATPPVVRFVPGTYGTTTWVSTTKTVAFGKGVKFTGGGIFTPKAVQVSALEDYVCDFAITDPNSEAHSSWFRTVAGFWRCGAGRLVMDDTNYFAANTMDSYVKVAGAKISGVKRMGAFTTQSNYLWFEECSFEGTGLFSAKDDYVKFTKCYVTDSLFTNLQYNQWDLGKISAGHHVECLSISANTFPLANFGSADVWLKFYDADQDNSLSPSVSVDLQGRTVNYFNYPRYTMVRNMTVSGDLVVPADGVLRQYKDVKVLGFVHAGNMMDLERCDFQFVDTANLQTLTATNSKLRSYSAVIDHSVAIKCTDCVFGLFVDNALDNETELGSIVLHGCVLNEPNQYIKTKRLYLVGCIIENVSITVWPYHDGVDYRIEGCMENCVVTGAYDVRYTKNHVDQYGAEETNCHHVKFNYRWCNNSFRGTMSKGIHIDFWGVLASRNFFMSRSGNDVVYEGNVGNCAPSKLSLSMTTSTDASPYLFYTDGTWNTTQWYLAGVAAQLRAFPGADSRTNGALFSDFAVHAYRYAWPFGALIQKHGCVDLMSDPNDYGDYCAVCFASTVSVGSSAVGLV